MELLNQSNYNVWKTCMDSYLVGEDLWDVVNGSYTSPPIDGSENSSAYKKWKQINAKAEFILKRSISHSLFDHIIKCKSAHEIWRTLDHLFNKKDEARLQILENELANTIQAIAPIEGSLIERTNAKEGGGISPKRKNLPRACPTHSPFPVPDPECGGVSLDPGHAPYSRSPNYVIE
ncbi:uncharacterized protein LOC132619627 [Lycium barbarum]|uniref:uncharacterized protein LOC132619627 n=1 Tax=Lycium barbarum TaxID=112863 RepID=UPI00293F6469|nr:uncharacterized protein LOC132619627 [Lycium barbarum]